MQFRVLLLLISTGALALGASSAAFATKQGYVTDSADSVVRDGSNDCVQTPRWSLDKAVEGCPGYVAPQVAEPAPPPPPPPPMPQYRNLTLEAGTLFEFDSSRIRPEAGAQLRELAADLRRSNAQVQRVIIEGHTCTIGTRAYNMRLSTDRANSVKNFLVAEGVPADKIQTVGYGPDRPAFSNATNEGRIKNRRVEITVDVVEQVR